MQNGKKIVVVLPACNAAKTLEMTCRDIPFNFVDDVTLVDDASRDDTEELACRLDIRTVIHPEKTAVQLFRPGRMGLVKARIFRDCQG